MLVFASLNIKSNISMKNDHFNGKNFWV